MQEAKVKFTSIGLNEGVVKNTLSNKGLTEKLLKVINLAKVTEQGLPKEKGNLLYSIASKTPNPLQKYLENITQYVMSSKFKSTKQIQECLKFLKAKQVAGEEFSTEQLELAAGVGIVVTEAEIDAVLTTLIEQNKEAILEEESSFNRGKLLQSPLAKEKLKWADGKLVNDMLKAKFEKLVGPIDDTKKVDKKVKKPNKASKNVGVVEEEKKVIEEPEKDPSTIKISDLLARQINSAVNSPELIKKHNEFTKGVIYTRFPPEPNGYLHIGHAKAMRFSFKVASELKGQTYLRFDDTNPEKESQEYIDNIIENVNWLGHKPFKITHASDYFDQLYNLAEELIKRGKAYICHQTKDEIKQYRNLMKESPHRNRSVQQNLKLFRNMKKGMYPENHCCLRMKIDMTHVMSAMRDPVAYRIRYKPHPHAGDKWCIYPTYDYTHCINDSLQHIDYSLCTLQFDSRRDSYYWLLQALDLYRPHVWQFSRLNVEYTVVSKRKLMRLISEGCVTGWDDPRFPTINGMRRKGYTPEAINNFCQEIGVTRRGNENITSIKLLEAHVRRQLDARSERTLAVTRPVKVNIINLKDDFDQTYDAPLFPTDKQRSKQTYPMHMTKTIWVDESDVSEKDVDGFYGIMPSNIVRLRYTFYVKMVNVERDPTTGKIKQVNVEKIEDEASVPKKKVKGFIHWVSDKYSLPAEFRMYDYLFTRKTPEKDAAEEKVDWMTYVNKNSLVVEGNARINTHLKGVKVYDRFQFERIGYFVVDKDTNAEKGKYVFNLTVSLKDSVEKQKLNEFMTSKKS